MAAIERRQNPALELNPVLRRWILKSAQPFGNVLLYELVCKGWSKPLRLLLQDKDWLSIKNYKPVDTGTDLDRLYEINDTLLHEAVRHKRIEVTGKALTLWGKYYKTHFVETPQNPLSKNYFSPQFIPKK